MKFEIDTRNKHFTLHVANDGARAIPYTKENSIFTIPDWELRVKRYMVLHVLEEHLGCVVEVEGVEKKKK